MSAVNQDGTPNSASNPAAVGSVVSLYATGEGAVTPGGAEGRIVTTERPLLPVNVLLGGMVVTPEFAGGSPGLIVGLLQVNIRIPAGVERSECSRGAASGRCCQPARRHDCSSLVHRAAGSIAWPPIKTRSTRKLSSSTRMSAAFPGSRLPVCFCNSDSLRRRKASHPNHVGQSGAGLCGHGADHVIHAHDGTCESAVRQPKPTVPSLSNDVPVSLGPNRY